MSKSFDVFHVHWPEELIRRKTAHERAIARLLFLLLLLKLAVCNIPIVRTQHNLRPHESGGVIERWLLKLLDLRTDLIIQLVEDASETRPHVVIPLGHYRDWYEGPVSQSRESGSVLFFGLIRPYKGLDDLIDVFDDSKLGQTLTIKGKPSSKAAKAALEVKILGKKSHINACLEHVPDDQTAYAVSSVEMMVLPFRSMLNSATILLALSFGTPVLVPRNSTTEALAREFGSEWVQTYSGGITGQIIDRALLEARSRIRLGAQPNLEQREWNAIGQSHVDAYEVALGWRPDHSS